MWDEARRLVAFMASRVTPEQRTAMPEAVRDAIAEALGGVEERTGPAELARQAA